MLYIKTDVFYRGINLNLEKYVIVCDESTKKGERYSYFYGGAIIKESQYEKFSNFLNDYKSKFGLNELKRTKITDKNYKDYIQVLELFFMFVKGGYIKLRMMFSPNEELIDRIPTVHNETFLKFYYAFIINAFSIFYAKHNIMLRLICDDLPETKEQCCKFKSCIVSKIKSNKKPNTNKVYLSSREIEEVDSRKHVILQCVDVVVGLLDFYLNSTVETLKSKRSQAKLKVWNFIFKNIEDIKPGIKLTETTKPIYSNKGWVDSYKHFVYQQKK